VDNVPGAIAAYRLRLDCLHTCLCELRRCFSWSRATRGCASPPLIVPPFPSAPLSPVLCCSRGHKLARNKGEPSYGALPPWAHFFPRLRCSTWHTGGVCVEFASPNSSSNSSNSSSLLPLSSPSPDVAGDMTETAYKAPCHTRYLFMSPHHRPSSPSSSTRAPH
jgi:hypothetical protein